MRTNLFFAACLLSATSVTAAALPFKTRETPLPKALSRIYKAAALPDGGTVVLFRDPHPHHSSRTRAAFIPAGSGTISYAVVPEHGDSGSEQFVGVAVLDASRVVFSTFWIDHSGTVRSGLAFFHRDGAAFRLEELVPSPPLYDLVPAANGTIAAVLFDAHAHSADGLPLLAIFDSSGRELARGAYVVPGAPASEVAAHAVHARLTAVGANRLALFDARSQKLHEIAGKDLRVERTVDLASYGAGKVLSILGFPNGSLLAVVRAGGQPGKRLIELAEDRPTAVHDLAATASHLWVGPTGEIAFLP